MSHISEPPIFSTTCIHTCLYRGFVLVRGGFCSGIVWAFFVRGGFCPYPLLSEYIHYNRKLNITFNFRFHMHEIFLKSVTSYALGPPSPCHKLSHLLGPPPPRAWRTLWTAPMGMCRIVTFIIYRHVQNFVLVRSEMGGTLTSPRSTSLDLLSGKSVLC